MAGQKGIPSNECKSTEGIQYRRGRHAEAGTAHLPGTAPEDPPPEALRGIAPVSYTHLDVYKRQESNR